MCMFTCISTCMYTCMDICNYLYADMCDSVYVCVYVCSARTDITPISPANSDSSPYLQREAGNNKEREEPKHYNNSTRNHTNIILANKAQRFGVNVCLSVSVCIRMLLPRIDWFSSRGKYENVFLVWFPLLWSNILLGVTAYSKTMRRRHCTLSLVLICL